MDPEAHGPDPTGLLSSSPAQGWSAVSDDDYDLAGPELDRERTVDAPLRTYALCSSPRSGSSLLSEALTFLGSAGAPIEYFDPTNAMRVVWRRWGCRSLPDYIDSLHHRRCSADGLFGVKVHWFQLVSVARALTGRSGGPVPMPDVALTFGRVAPGAVVIRVLREDRERQALSWARAERTGHWRARTGGASSPAPAIPRAERDHFLRRLVDEEAAWTALLDRVGIVPLVVRYEDLCDDFAATVRATARHIGCPSDIEIPPPRLVRQSH